MSAAENDMRQGVTIGGHEVLDMVDARRGERIDIGREGEAIAADVRALRLYIGNSHARDCARAAAARLILIVDEIDRRTA